MSGNSMVSASDWLKGIFFSIVASIIGGASKLAIRKSWLLVQGHVPLDSVSSSSSQEGPTGTSTADPRVTSQDVDPRIPATTGRTTYTNPSTSPTNPSHLKSTSYPPEESFQCHRSDFTFDMFSRSISVDDKNDTEPNISSHVPLEDKKNVTNPHGEIYEDDSDMTRSSRSIPYYTFEYHAAGMNSSTMDRIHFPDRDELSQHKRIQRTAIALRAAGMIGMTFLNPFFCVLAMKYASPSILAPFSGLTLVWVIVFAEMLIGEKPRPKQILAASLVILGEIIVAIWGDHTNDSGMTVSDVIHSYHERDLKIYFFFMLIWMYILFYCIQTQQSQAIHRFAWGVSGGSLTGLQNFLKDSLTIMKASKVEGTANPWYLWIFILCAILTAFLGLILLTACMKRYDALFSSAMFVGSFVVSASIMSIVHYHTFEHLDNTLHCVMYPLGLVILLVGVFILVEETTNHLLHTSNHAHSSTHRHDPNQESHSTIIKHDLSEPLVRGT